MKFRPKRQLFLRQASRLASFSNLVTAHTGKLGAVAIGVVRVYSTVPFFGAFPCQTIDGK